MTKISLMSVARAVYSLKMDGGERSAKELAKPRYIESLCFIQAMSQLPGGLEQFCEDFLKQCGAQGFLRELPARMAWDYLWKDLDRYYEELEEGGEARLEEAKSHKAAGQSNAIEVCALVEYLSAWCGAGRAGNDFGLEFSNRWPAFLEALGVFMDAYAQAEIGKTADTSLRRKVFEELDFARKECVPVSLVADTRHGKTTAAESYCKAWPGRARVVTVPASNRERDLLRAHAEAYGLKFTPSTPTPHLKEWVEFTQRYTKLFLLYDESHYLIPIEYHKDTPPRRLEWVRTEVIDRGIACAFLATPQSTDETLQRYAEKTKYRLGQWVGRIAPPVVLSDEPTDDDYMAVSRLRFPEFPHRVLVGLCALAAVGQNGYKTLDLVARRAHHESSIRGADRVTLADVAKAAEWAGMRIPTGSGNVKVVAADRSKDEFGGHGRNSPMPRVAAADGLQGARSRGVVTDIPALTVPA